MKASNGYGTVVKLSGNRRRPYAVRKSEGLTEKGYPKQKYIGYFATLREAKHFLAEYNYKHRDDNDLTLQEVWESYLEKIVKCKAETSVKNEKGFFALFEPLKNRVFSDIRPVEVQQVIDEQKPTRKGHIKAFWTNLEKHAVFLQIPSKRFGESLTAPIPDSKERKVVSEQDIDYLKAHKDEPLCADALILIYTGMRITEYLTLKKSDIADGVITCGIKSQSGKNRRIPIHPIILPLIKEKCENSPSKFVVGGDYYTFRTEWNKNEVLKHYRFHECRHTFRTRLDNAGASNKCMDMLLGHKSKYVGDRVYNHKTIEELTDAVNLLE